MEAKVGGTRNRFVFRGPAFFKAKGQSPGVQVRCGLCSRALAHGREEGGAPFGGGQAHEMTHRCAESFCILGTLFAPPFPPLDS